MTRYNNSQLANYNDQYKGTSQINYPQYPGGLSVDYPRENTSRINYAYHPSPTINHPQRDEVALQVDYPQHLELYSTNSYNHPTATWSDPGLTSPYSAGSGMSSSNPGLASHVHPTRYSSYPPVSYPPSSNYTSYSATELSTSWNSSPSPLSNTNVLPPSYPSSSSYTSSPSPLANTRVLPPSYPPSSYASSSYLPTDPHQYPPYTTRSSSTQLSTPGSSEAMLSPYSTASVPLSSSPGGTPPVDPSHYNSSSGEEESLLLSHVRVSLGPLPSFELT
ncbi:hypothetical protein GGU11DRAFT_255773 [Lentinula aff. detonsa]|nr:hypothetical protein GGU11DRAFT_255773 [Lentinula aff. detonsa]